MAINEHINTFEKGLFSDTNIVLQPDGTYRFMKNCQLINQDNNNYVVKDCLGNVLTFTINPLYDALFTEIDERFPMPIGFISFPNKLIVFSTNNQSVDGGYGEIGIINYDPYGEGVQPRAASGQYNAGYIPLYHDAGLNFTWQHRIEGFGFEENELIQRVYWTDNFNQPRVFNITDPLFSSYIASGNLVTGEEYMILEGAIEHPIASGLRYGPGLTLGNTFTASTATYTNLTGSAPTPKVIEYYSPQMMSFTPDRNTGEIKFVEFTGGNLICGAKVYYYRFSGDRLSINNNIAPTAWSYGSYPLPVGTGNDYIIGNEYHDYVGGGTTVATKNSGLGVIISINNIDTRYKYLEVACSEFDQLIDAPRQTTIIAKVEIIGAEMEVIHTGNTNLGNLTYPTDFTTFPASVLRCKTMTTSKNYAIIGNIEERDELGWNPVGVLLDQFQYPMNVHRDADSCSLSGMVYSGVSPTSGVNPTSGQIRPWERYAVVSGGTVTYNAVIYSPGQVFVGVVGTTTFTTTGTPVIRPAHTRNRYNTAGSVRVENYIEIKNNDLYGDDCFWDYKSAAAHTHCAGYWSDETYTFGILPWDLKGKPYPVIPIGTYQFDDVLTKSGLIRSDAFGADLVYSLNPSGLTINNLVLPQSSLSDVISKISGFSIVRALRDPRIITQGLVTQNTTNGATPPIYSPGAWIPVSLDANTAVASATYTGVFPDLLVDCPLKGAVGLLGDTMESACWVDPYDYGAGVRVRGSGPVASEQVYSKAITNLTADTTARTGFITYWSEANEGATLSDLGSGVTFVNNMTTAAALVNVEGACVTAGLDYTLNSYKATGGKKIVFKLNADFLHYGPSANGYSSTAAAAQTEKVIMNYVKTGKTEFYTGPQENIIYISTGHYQPINSAVLAQLPTDISGNHIFNNIEIFGGDCFTSLIDYGYGLWNSDDVNKYSYAWTFPCECNSNYNLRRGRKTSNVEMWYTGITAGSDAIVFKNSAIIHLEDFSYNQGYSAENFAVGYVSLPENFIPANEFKIRIRHSNKKTIGELIDSFRIFSILAFLDIDGSGGEINVIKVKDARVVVWQNMMTTTVPILERQLLAAPLGDPTTIGTGGVVDRFDPLNSYFGTQHQWSVIETEFGFVWFDMRRKAFMSMTSDGGILEVSQVLGLQDFFNEVFLEVVGNTLTESSTLLNSPTFELTSDMPLMGIGIHGVYDPKFKVTYMTFKFKQRKRNVTDFYFVKDFTIGYLHSNTDRMFVGFYDILPAICHRHNSFVMMCNNPKNTNQFINPPPIPATFSFAIGDTLQGQDIIGITTNEEYICILALTMDTAAKYPLGASSATYWVKINQTNQIWVLNQPATLGLATAPDYQYNKFFGRVVDNQMDVVVNPGKGSIGSFYVGSYKQSGPFNVNYTTITVSAVNQTGQDASIRSTDRNYRFVYDGIEANSPLSSTGRIINKFNLFQFVKRNWTTVPTTITTSVKILEKLISRFTRKF